MENKTTYHFHFTFLLIYIIDRRVKDYICSTYTLTTGEELSCLLKPHEYPVEIKSSNPIIRQIKVQTMNGRVYDPFTASFLSPDNYVQVPDYTPGFNRYAYALNNPLVYTDPDGNNPLIFGLFTLAWSANMAGLASMSAGGTYWQGFGTGITTGIMGAGLGYLGTNVLGITGAIPGTLWGIGSGGLIGGLTAEVAGGNFWSGALSGGIMGGLTGGFSGYMRARRLHANIWTGSLDPSLDYIVENEIGNAATLTSDYGIGVKESDYHVARNRNLPEGFINNGGLIKVPESEGGFKVYGMADPTGSKPGEGNSMQGTSIYISKDIIRYYYLGDKSFAAEIVKHEFFHTKDYYSGNYMTEAYRLRNLGVLDKDIGNIMIQWQEKRAYQFNSV